MIQRWDSATVTVIDDAHGKMTKCRSAELLPRITRFATIFAGPSQFKLRSLRANALRKDAMSVSSTIEWTDSTWNPVRGCTKISQGCKNCYAMRFAERFRGISGHPFEFGFDLRLVPAKLGDPLRWAKPRKIFVNSMSDLFHDQVPAEYIQRVGQVMITANWHQFQVLTKRSGRMKTLLSGPLYPAAKQDHVLWGVSVEDRKSGVPRIADLQESAAKHRFLSIEPLLEDLGEIDLAGIDWVIVGGESGPGARPIQREWVLSLRDQCLSRNVAFFFKQWGGVRKKQTGNQLDGRTYSDFPPIKTAPIPGQTQRNLLREELCI